MCQPPHLFFPFPSLSPSRAAGGAGGRPSRRPNRGTHLARRWGRPAPAGDNADAASGARDVSLGLHGAHRLHSCRRRWVVPPSRAMRRVWSPRCPPARAARRCRASALLLPVRRGRHGARGCNRRGGRGCGRCCCRSSRSREEKGGSKVRLICGPTFY